jgi:hypothetical protein
MQSAVVSTVSFHKDGSAQYVEYDRYQLRILTVRQSMQGSPTNSGPPSEAFSRSYWGTPGLGGGDQFRIEHDGRFTAGELDAASVAIRGWVQKLLTQARKLPEVKLAPAYLMLRAVAPDRRVALENRGRIFSDVKSLDAKLGRFFVRTQQRGDFFPLNNEDLQSLRATPKWEYLIHHTSRRSKSGESHRSGWAATRRKKEKRIP